MESLLKRRLQGKMPSRLGESRSGKTELRATFSGRVVMGGEEVLVNMAGGLIYGR